MWRSRKVYVCVNPREPKMILGIALAMYHLRFTLYVVSNKTWDCFLYLSHSYYCWILTTEMKFQMSVIIHCDASWLPQFLILGQYLCIWNTNFCRIHLIFQYIFIWIFINFIGFISTVVTSFWLPSFLSVCIQLHSYLLFLTKHQNWKPQKMHYRYLF